MFYRLSLHSEKAAQKSGKPFPCGDRFNVYIYLAYLHKGVDPSVMNALVQEARRLKVVSVDLLDTKEGKPLCKKLGFHSPNYTA